MLARRVEAVVLPEAAGLGFTAPERRILAVLLELDPATGNPRCLCRTHHRLGTLFDGWAFVKEPDGTLHVTTPSGDHPHHPTTRPPPTTTARPRRPASVLIDEGTCRPAEKSTNRHVPSATVRAVIVIAAVVAHVLLAGLTVLQVALAAGAPLGHLAWGGRHRVLPRGLRIASAVSVLLYAAFAWIIATAADRAEEVGDHRPGYPLVWVLTAYFAVGVLANAASRSRRERFVMTPVALVLALCCLTISLALP
ncbi:hypothetical protein [Geodermatophilus sp. SYSU D00815]